ncbi:MAG: Ig-like domain-containing protein [Planctomycetota bacterium]
MICFLAWCLVVNTSVLAAPSDGVFTVGTGTIEYGANTAVTVDQVQSIIEWGAPGSGGIDTATGEFLTFLQAEGLTDSAVLNRIMSGNPTQFDGTLSGTDMRIFVVNPAGIVFGAGSRINVSQLVASGLNMSDADFLNATGESPTDLRFEGGDGIVRNHALIQANKVFLVGKKVINNYGIITPDGLTVLAAGDNVYIAQDGSNVVVQLDADPGDTLPDVYNYHTIRAKNGSIVLAAGDLYSRAILNDGHIEAEAGTITAQAARIENMGHITVDADTYHAVDTDGDGGSITLTGSEAVVFDEGAFGIGQATANAGINGNGGSITVESEGTVTIGEGTLVSARGGSESGDGGSVKITAEHFLIAGEIDASPGNTDYEPGTLEVDPAIVTIASGPNPATLEPPEEPALDTLYEQDIETWGSKGTSLVVYADDSIIVEDILDGEIKGRYGNIELYATGADSSVSFDDTADTISTTLGDIMMTAGSGGLTIGSLETAKDDSDEKPTPGQIALSTHDGGDITAENLTIKDGWGRAEINVDATGALTVNGDVIVGRDADIHNVPSGENAEAVVILKAGDNVVLNGQVGAYAHGIDDDVVEGDVTRAEIRILAGTNTNETGDAHINGDLVADAQSSSQGTSDATIEVNAWGNITFGAGAEAYAITDNGPPTGSDAGPGTVDDEETSPDGDHAQIIITAQDYPVPPPIGIDDAVSVSKNAGNTPVDVLANDTQGGDPLAGGVINSHTEPTAGTLTPILEGEDVVSFEYNPPEDLSTLTFDPEGNATVTFTYVAEVDGQLSGETTVTITLTNGLPVAVPDATITTQDAAVLIDVLANDSDPDGDPMTATAASDPAHGTLTQNPDGTFTYTPAEGFVGADSFTYSATDNLNSSPVQTVSVTVNPIVVPLPGPAPIVSPVAPGLERVEFEVSGCPALVRWAAQELEVREMTVQIRIANALALTRDIQPCDMCASLKQAATILQDADGTHIAALAQVINESASAAAPPTEEQMASIADTIARNAEGQNRYAVAGEYLDAIAEYVGILAGEMGFSPQEAVQFVTDKYIGRLAETGNAGVAAMAARLATLAAQ